jgi:hypothetical protein
MDRSRIRIWKRIIALHYAYNEYANFHGTIYESRVNELTNFNWYIRVVFRFWK